MIISESSGNKHKAKSEIVENEDDFIGCFLAKYDKLEDKEDGNDDNNGDSFDPERIINLAFQDIPTISESKDDISSAMDSKESPINSAVADMI